MAGRLMILDRHPGICCVLATALESQCDIIWAASEYEALRGVSERAPDVLVLDASLSVQWSDLFQTIRMKAPKCDIITVVPAGQLAVVRQFMRMGADAIFDRHREIGGLLRRISERLVLDVGARLPWHACNQHVDRALEYLADHLLETVTVQ